MVGQYSNFFPTPIRSQRGKNCPRHKAPPQRVPADICPKSKSSAASSASVTAEQIESSRGCSKRGPWDPRGGGTQKTSKGVIRHHRSSQKRQTLPPHPPKIFCSLEKETANFFPSWILATELTVPLWCGLLREGFRTQWMNAHSFAFCTWICMRVCFFSFGIIVIRGCFY